ncbi:hypothetical protein FOXG_11592 [Fusarium oxysporum f. sp. lycopersici 4287]|uniref:Amino acid permease/ SLC12A domain-containing protein n=2 Tax=Fusarium oxysporum TaxID=5507 RepID=A0A0J9VL95_FUSO4|nr:hypothetical protein FOXG_11592 [Fusarium oxysporum f. sp. lycopersici 4287]XP_018249903.1 hypothetical protein FOXG_11592 [Fusarium oxysporum f. sp. lycopersici 4287]KNB11857.1 hypothetical protein FOXG_11592 [Fusarium oxysporum f. sp. lycopersici 4287]KNB11858.1 hypothetical protein FOXG_11592 [Fusarium oxysporum f. sp. lycopersici 4287]
MSVDVLAGGKANPSMGVETRNDNNGDLVTATEEQSLQRGLHERHLSMLGIAGAIGTGLFLGLGQSVQTGGPLGALLGYATVGLVVCAVQFALGEVAALLPVTGAFVRHAEFLVDPAWGFAIGWNLVYGNILSIPSEITAICVLFEFWTDINPSLWIMIFIVLTTVVGLCFVRVFGEVEFWFALLKILLVVFLIILGLVINLGGVPGTERIGFRYWKDPGPFVEYIATGSWGQFLGYWSVMTSAVFSFAGVESIAMAAAETRNPARAIPKACKNVFIRILVFYILAILIVGMLVRSDDERLKRPVRSRRQSPLCHRSLGGRYPSDPLRCQRRCHNFRVVGFQSESSRRYPCSLWSGPQATGASDLPPYNRVGCALRLRALLHLLHVPQLHESLKWSYDRFLVASRPDSGGSADLLGVNLVESHSSAPCDEKARNSGRKPALAQLLDFLLFLRRFVHDSAYPPHGRFPRLYQG